MNDFEVNLQTIEWYNWTMNTDKKTRPAPKYDVDQRVRLTEEYVADIERVTGLKVPDGGKVGTVVWTYFDDDARDEKGNAVEAWMYGVRWDAGGSAGVYENALISATAV